MTMQARTILDIRRKYNPRVWFVLAAAWLSLAADVTDRRTQTVPLPQGKAISIDISIGAVRVEGWDQPDTAEITIERRAPSTSALSSLTASIDDSTARVAITARQPDGETDPAYRSDVTVRLPRTALIERIQIVEGRLTLSGLSGSMTASIRRGPIDAKDLAGTVRLSAEKGSIALTGASLTEGGLLRLRTFNGDIRLALAARPEHARIMALALNGTIQSTIPLTVRDAWGPRWSEATLGRGEPVISLDVVNGTIQLTSP